MAQSYLHSTGIICIVAVANVALPEHIAWQPLQAMCRYWGCLPVQGRPHRVKSEAGKGRAAFGAGREGARWRVDQVQEEGKLGGIAAPTES